MCLNGLSCSENAGKLHSESTKFHIFLEEHSPKPPFDWRKMSAQARGAKNHVVGFRKCYWFSVRKCSREGKKNGRRLRVDRLEVFLPF